MASVETRREKERKGERARVRERKIENFWIQLISLDREERELQKTQARYHFALERQDVCLAYLVVGM